MSQVADILTEEFEALKLELIAKYDELGMRSSGKWADGLEVVVSENKASIKGYEYTQQLETGRAPGKQPPSEAIEQWIKDKGIASRIEGKISVSSLAFLIARKIGREGWKRQEHGGVDLINQVVTPERIQKILDRISDIYVVNFTNDLINVLQAA
jgi:hypothetical protein